MKKKKKVLIKRMRRGLSVVLYILTILILFMGIRIAYIDYKYGDQYQRNSISQKNYESVSIPYKRGDILDTNGTILATSIKKYNLIIEPGNILRYEENKKITVDALKKYFNLTDAQMDAYLANESSMYQVVTEAKGLSYDQMNEFKKYCDTKEGKKVIGVRFEETYDRTYPYNEVACHVLGYTVSGNVGQTGVEKYYNSTLNGEDGRRYKYLSSDYTLQSNIEPAVDGNTIITTIDIEAQRIVQENCEQYMEETGAENISVIVMDPATSAVIALYNVNQYDCNDPYDINAARFYFLDEKGNHMDDAAIDAKIATMSDAEKVEYLEKVWTSYAVYNNFEPGSTYKPFTVAGALEEGVVTPDEGGYFCGGSYHVEDRDIACHNLNGHGQVTVSEAIQKSCNVALMQIAQKEGRSIFIKYQNLFGFGQRTNIDIAGEQSAEALQNVVYQEEELNPVELATCSFGQGINVTMMQLCTAFSSIVNGGNLYEPYVVKQIKDADGNVISTHDPVLLRKTISDETSEEMKEMFRLAVLQGTAQLAQTEGYSIGGKTGTAEKLPRGNHKFILSFIGAVPIENPEVVMYVTIDQPHVEGDAAHSVAGCVLYHMIAEDLFPYMNITRTEPEEETNESEGF